MMNFEVEHYIRQVIQKFRCLKNGHTSKQCKSTERCQISSLEHIENEISSIENLVYTQPHSIKNIMVYQITTI